MSMDGKQEPPKHIKLPKSQITPEFISKIHKLREKKRVENEENNPEFLNPKYDFIKRDILTLPNVEKLNNSVDLKIMTYNTLSQSLIRREIYPDAHDAIKWHVRSKVILNEIKYYNCDIMCFQEVDVIQWDKFWVPELNKLGYEGEFYKDFKGPKVHGVAIFWRFNIFEKCDIIRLNFDDLVAGNAISKTTRTWNVGLIVALTFKTSDAKFRSGIVIGTTHLFWHPFGTFERTRQLAILLQEFRKLIDNLNFECGQISEMSNYWLPILTGDFNSQPCDMPYLSITRKPISASGEAKTVIECSTAYKFSRRRNGNTNSSEEVDHNEEAQSEKEVEEEDEEESNPVDPRPSSFEATPEQKNLVAELEKVHNSINLKATSLFGIAYKKVHSTDLTCKNEPELSHTSIFWTGLLDYIFILEPWNEVGGTDGGSLEDFEKRMSLKIKGLLEMPKIKELPKNVQPHQGQYPSDHLSMICDLNVGI